MNVNLEKQDIINMLCGFVPSLNQCQQLERIGAMKDTGNGWNVGWKWNRSILNRIDETTLFNLYTVLARPCDDQIKQFGDKVNVENTKKESVEDVQLR